MNTGGAWYMYQLIVLVFMIWPCQSVCEVFDQADNSQLERCAIIKVVLKSALVLSNANLYVLQEVFLSSNSPTLLEINYIVQLSDSQSNHIDYPHRVTWTKSSILANFNPKILLALQPGITTRLHKGDITHRNITLILNVLADELPPRKPTRTEEIQEVLESISLQLQHIAAQTKESHTNNDGYIAVWSLTDHSKYSITNVLFLIAAILLAVFSLTMTATLSLKLFKQRSHGHSTDISAQLLGSLCKVTTFLNILEGVFTVVSLVEELSSPMTDVIYCLTKGGILAVVITIPPTIGTLTGCIKYRYCTRKTTNYSKSSLLRLMMYWYGLCNLYVFVFLMALYLIPTVILIFVHPLVISTTLFICASVFCLMSVLALPSPCHAIPQWSKIGKNISDLKQTKISNASLYLIPSMMIVLVMFPVLSSLLVRQEFTHTNEFMKCALLFLPTAMLLVIGIIAVIELNRKTRGDDNYA